MTYESFPDIPIRTFRFELNENKATSQSAFTGQTRSVSLSGGVSDRWQGSLTTPLLRPAQVKTMMTFLLKVGLYGRFNLKHPDYSGASSGEIVGLVNGAGQSGRTIQADGFTPSTVILREGEYFQVRDEYKRATRDITSNSSGEATLRFVPPLRVSPANNDPVDLSTPEMLVELLTVPSEDTDHLGMQAFTIQFQEALVYE